MSAAWGSSARVVLGASLGAASSSSSSSVNAVARASTSFNRPYRLSRVVNDLPKSRRSLSASRPGLVDDIDNTHSNTTTPIIKSGPLRRERRTRESSEPFKPEGDKGIEYIHATRTWGGVPVPLYASDRTGRKAAIDHSSPQRQLLDDIGYGDSVDASAGTDALQANETLLRGDADLRAMVSRLAKYAEQGDMVATVNACRSIKAHLMALARQRPRDNTVKTAKSSDVPVPPTYVYNMMLKVFSTHGQVDVCHDVLEDMRAIGITIGMEQLDWLLRAAVLSGNHDEVDSVLVQIKDLSGGQETYDTDTSQRALDGQASPSFSILSSAFMRNWTPATYQHMFQYCQLTHALEYGLALLGAASQRSKADATTQNISPSPAHERSSGHVPFIKQVLNPSTTQCILILTREARQARLTADLALWMDNGVALRKLDVTTWMGVLRCCADGDYYPGVALAWERAVERGLLLPDEGLLLAVLNCASRGRRAEFIERALSTFMRYAPSTFALQEWHLLPLLEAQCLQHDFEAAMRTATRLARLDISHDRPSPMRLLALLRMATSTPATTVKAYHAFLNVGRAAIDGKDNNNNGVTTETMNVMIRTANFMGMHDMALKVFGVRRYVRNERTPAGMQPPKLPDLFAGIEKSDQTDDNVMHTLDAVRAEEAIWTQKGAVDQKNTSNTAVTLAEAWDGMGLQPDVHTINGLLSTAINLKSAIVGRFVFDQLNVHRIQADATTYERAIVLSVTQPKYEEAFAFLEEAKARGIMPTRDAYRALGVRCLQEKDERWIEVGQEILRNGQHPGNELIDALERGGWLDSRKLRPFTEEFLQQQKARSDRRLTTSGNRD